MRSHNRYQTSNLTLVTNNLLWITVLLWLTACSDAPTLPKLQADAVILAYGDSLTYGTGADRSESYPAMLATLTGRKVINAGVPGEVSQRGLERLPGLLKQHQPDLLILCHGGNDLLKKNSLDQTAENIRKMVQLAQQQKIPVILLGVPQPGLFLKSADLYRDVADATGVPLIEDLLARILGDASLKSDPIHPNREGYLQIAEHITAFMKRNGAI